MEVPVLIVGAGPVGMLMAALLADQGIASLLIEQRDDLHLAPQAHVINARTQEILASIGVTDEDLAGITTHAAGARFVTWRRNLAEADLARIDIASDTYLANLAAASSKRTANIPQHHLERLLFAQVSRRARCEACFGQVWQSAEHNAQGVVSVVRDAATGEAYRVRSDWLIAADGAGSAVRRGLGLPMVGDQPGASRHHQLRGGHPAPGQGQSVDPVLDPFGASPGHVHRARCGALLRVHDAVFPGVRIACRFLRGQVRAHVAGRAWRAPPAFAHHIAVELDDAGAHCRAIQQGTGLPGRRRRAPFPAHRRARAEHRRGRRAQPGVEAGPCHERKGRQGAARHLWRRAQAGRRGQQPRQRGQPSKDGAGDRGARP
ncbi:PheA/TfdB family FAD-binding monooxygenase [Cupriavidus basilensis OR16]|uniref:PheA/TfdB family FAD-binding monooxygenase n=1 Tax=Cupriavidus basilensis OR16 TaxID=1127483 RepID=H1S4W8_9BURK|nr:PheA/TfdB family FAD-binding monooxygenase [Cupriavidus basilensis OR16]